MDQKCSDIWQHMTEPEQGRQQGNTVLASERYARTNPRKYSFAVHAHEKWNNLPEDVKASQNREIFRRKLKKL
jgi:hypothetical protein